MKTDHERDYKLEDKVKSEPNQRVKKLNYYAIHTDLQEEHLSK